ncbi:MAG: cytochrome C554 [Bacteroidia bacterium]|nr:cytochrome C554 [Bacteroidia bacterium]
MMYKKYLFVICLSLLIAGTVSAQTYKYIGADKCKVCHNKPAKGEQYNKWMKEKHSQALKSLASQASIDYAKKNGIADATKEPKCLKCHSTYDAVAANLRGGILATEGVSCESCHGPGSAYKSPTIMKNKAMALKNGLVIPDEKVCKTCHNPENPFHKEFKYADAVAKIAHPDPTLTKK